MLIFILSEVDISAAINGVAAIALIVAAGLTLLKARKFIEDRVADALKKDEVVKQLSVLVKPDLIFDQRESVLADRGASAFIREQGIHVKMGSLFGKSDSRQVPVEIRIEFSKHLAVPPLLTPLNADVVTITTKRGKDFEWIYILDYSMGGDYDETYAHKYRLEIF
jgi:hypothetical protein